MGVNKIAAGICGLVLFLAAAAGMAAGTFQVELRTPRWVDLTVTQAEHLREDAVQLLESAAFNSLDNPGVLRESPADLRRRFQATTSGPHLVVTLDEPRAIRSLDDGDTPVVQILIGLDRTRPSGVFTVDQHGQLCAHEKYSGELLAELFDLTDAIVLKNSARSYTF